jgi:hypothetical protein
MAAIDYQKYIDSINYDFNYLSIIDLPKLNLEQIEQVEEPYRKLLYSYYGYITQLDNYTIDELDENFYYIDDDCCKNVYMLAVISNNLKTIKYLHSININYNNLIDSYFDNTYIMAIHYGCFKIIKYYDSNNIIFYTMGNYYLSTSGKSGLLKMIKYFELKAKDDPNFELQIIYCYINAAEGSKAKIRILKYLETKYPLYITDDIIYIAKRCAIINERFEKIKYLNRNNTYPDYWAINYMFCCAYNELLDRGNKNKAIHIIKYVFSKINKIESDEYIYIYSEIFLQPIFNQVRNYQIRYRAKYMALYI